MIARWMPSGLALAAVLMLSVGGAATHIDTLHKDDCVKLLDVFNNQNGELVQCAIQHAEPVTYCRNCVDLYIAFNQSYAGLVGNATCREMYVDRDRLNILLMTHEQSQGLWDAGSCSECFKRVNGSTTHNLTQNTQHFYDLLTATQTCIELNQKNLTEVCALCVTDYTKLNELYNELKTHMPEENLCFDIRDVMNATRRKWSMDLKCCRDRHESLTAFFALSGVMVLIPVLFYAGFFAHQQRVEAAEYISDAVSGGATQTGRPGTQQHRAGEASTSTSEAYPNGAVGSAGNANVVVERHSHEANAPDDREQAQGGAIRKKRQEKLISVDSSDDEIVADTRADGAPVNAKKMHQTDKTNLLSLDSSDDDLAEESYVPYESAISSKPAPAKRKGSGRLG